jgi:hypothetical protein
MKNSLPVLVIFFLLATVSCKKDDSINTTNDSGKINLHFRHRVQGDPLQTDSLIYVNAAGNQYMINELQYFISDVKLHNTDGSTVLIKAWDDIHYIDSDIPSTQTWYVQDDIPAGNYSSMSFTFGIPDDKNISFMYVNPPEKDMFWPEFLGGGYHYLKLNGKWKDTTNTETPFDFHLGRGQIYAGGVITVDSITGFIDNSFVISLPASFTISKDQTLNITIDMNVESWFDSPHIWDFNYWGSYIMQNQDAMQKVRENGADVFSISSIE